MYLHQLISFRSEFEHEGQALILALVRLVTVLTDTKAVSNFDKTYQGLIWEIISDYNHKLISMFKDAEAKDKEHVIGKWKGLNLSGRPNISALYSIPKQISFLQDLEYADTSRVSYGLRFVSYFISLKVAMQEEGRQGKEPTKKVIKMY